MRVGTINLMWGIIAVFLLAVVAGCTPEDDAATAPTLTVERTEATTPRVQRPFMTELTPDPVEIPKKTPAPEPPVEVPMPTATPEPIRLRSADNPWYYNPPTEIYGEPVFGGTLRINYHEPLEHANVWGLASGAADMYRAPTGGGLLMENPYDGGGTLVPDLAQGWAFGDNLESITFHFRDNIYWHSGEPFFCEDARFTFETMITGQGITDSYMRSRLANVMPDGMECLDDLTLVINLKSPTADSTFFSFSNYRALVFNKAWFLEGGERAMFQDVSMGIGPFVWAEGQSVGINEQRFNKNQYYYDYYLPYVDELVIYGILDESTQLATHLAHQTDWHWVRNWDQYKAYVDHDQIVTVIRPTPTSFRVVFDERYAPLDNVRVRQALVMGIDRTAAIQIFEDGHAMAGGFGYAPDSPSRLPREQLCSVPGWCVYDDMKSVRADARGMLVWEGFDFERTYLLSVGAHRNIQERAIFVQEQLLLLGIKTELNVVQTAALRKQQATSGWGDFMHLVLTAPTDDPDHRVSTFPGCDSWSNSWTPSLCNEDIVALLEQVRNESDDQERLQLAHQVELARMSHYNQFPLYWEMEAAAFWPEVRGYTHFPEPAGSFLKFMHMWINPNRKNDTGYAGQTSGVPGGFQ